MTLEFNLPLTRESLDVGRLQLSCVCREVRP